MVRSLTLCGLDRVLALPVCRREAVAAVLFGSRASAGMGEALGTARSSRASRKRRRRDGFTVRSSWLGVFGGAVSPPCPFQRQPTRRGDRIFLTPPVPARYTGAQLDRDFKGAFRMLN